MAKKIYLTAVALVFVVAGYSLPSIAGEVEVLHWWTSGGEAKSVSTLKKMLQKEGHKWKDFAVSGGGGTNAMTVLKSRAVSGNPPAAAQMKGPQIQFWAEEGLLRDLDVVAKAQGWDKKLPKAVSKVMKYKNRYVAVPVNVHRINWMWCNPKIFKKAGAKIPKTWSEFEVAAKKIKKSGSIPVAFGGQSWQEATVFESIVLGVGGPQFYKKALVDLNITALKSPKMVKSFETLKMIKKYTDKNAPGRDWNLATAMVYKGEAAMQFMGDWAKGEFKVAGKKPQIDYTAVAVPQTHGAFLFNIDSFVMFKVKKANRSAQEAMARLMLSNDFQILFNLNKGSIPVRIDVAMTKFDIYGKKSMDDFKYSAKKGTLLPSMAHEMAVAPAVRGAIFDVVTNFYNSNGDPKVASEKLAKAVAAEMEP